VSSSIDLKVFIIPQIKLETEGVQGNLIINKALDKKAHDVLLRRATQIVERLSQYKVPFEGQFFEEDKITMISNDGAQRFQFVWVLQADGMQKGRTLLKVNNLNAPRVGKKETHAKARADAHG
jgi:hypothetical protein